jgi:hypothetical protein
MRLSARLTATVLALTVLAPVGGVTASSAAAASSCPLPTFGPGSNYHPVIDPTRFGPNVDNPWFPLTPGKINVYVGTKDGKRALNVVAPSTRTRVIDGVTTRIVEDRLYLNDVLEEKTADYYAQDECGNVWYFGEDTATVDRHGHVTSREGSFHAGVKGAEPGVFMQASPEIGRQFRQEWSPGQAEDRFTAIDLSAHVRVPAGNFNHALRTKEATDLEPGVLDNKVYAKGVGEVVEEAVKGPTEKLVLIEVID